MNALIMPLLFSRFDTTAPAGLVPASSALAKNTPSIKTDFARKTPKNEGIRTFAQFAIALGKPMKKE
jgi:hypothetical protein